MAATQSKTVAETLMTGLGKDLTFPNPELNSPEFTTPAESAFAEAPERIGIEELTAGFPGGSGNYDKIMESNKAHLRQQYEKGLITGEDYTKAYIELTTAALTTAVEFTLQKGNAYWQANMVQMQGRRAEIEAVTARVQLEIAKAELIAAQRQAELVNSQYVLTQMQIAKADAEFRATEKNIEISEAQRLGIETDNVIKTFQLTTMMPKEAAQLDAQTEQVIAQTSLAVSQELGVVAETANVQYRLDNLLPAELGQITANTNQTTAQTSLVASQQLGVVKDTEIAGYRLDNLLPKEGLQMDAQTALTDSQKSQVDGQTELTASQRLGVVKETEVSTYRLDFMLPQELTNMISGNELVIEQTETERSRKLTQDSQTHVNNKQAALLHEQGCHEEVKKNLTNHQIAMTQEQTEVQRSQTQDIRRDGSPVAGVVSRQKENLEKEILVKDSQIQLVASQVMLVNEQVEAQRGQTTDTRRDGLTITGMLGKQKELYGEQIVAYKKDATQKVAKLYSDAWTIGKSMDENFPVPTEFTETSINTVLASLRNSNL